MTTYFYWQNLRMIDKLKSILPIGVLIALVASVMAVGLGLFYEQDEWQGLGNILAYKDDFITLNINGAIPLLLGEGRLLASVLTKHLLGNYPLNIQPIIYFSIFFHSLNVVLVYLLAKRHVGNSLFAFIGAAFFAVNSVAQEAITWPGAIVGTLPATTLILISVGLFLEFIKNNRFVFGAVSLGVLYLSLFFKEIGSILFLVFPVFPVFTFFTRKKVNLKIVLLFLVFAGLSISARIIPLRSSTPEDLFVTGSSNSFWLKLVSHAFLYPITSFSLLFVPSIPALDLARFFTRTYYSYLPPAAFDLIAQTVVLDLMAIVLTFSLLALLLFAAVKANKQSRYEIFFWTVFVLTSFLPYVVVSKTYSYLESRYYYLAAAGSALLLCYVLKVAKDNKRRVVLLGLITVFSALTLTHYYYLNQTVTRKVQDSNRRREIVHSLQTHLTAKSKTIYFLEGDRNFYIEKGNPLPLQHGTGYTLLILNYKGLSEQDDLLKQKFLWDLGSQGYKEIGGYGFGYFWNRDELHKFLENNNLKGIEIITLRYESKENKIERTNLDGISSYQP